MATKDHSLLFNHNKKHESFVLNAAFNGQYSNLNLNNQNKQCFSENIVGSSKCGVTNESRKSDDTNDSSQKKREDFSREKLIKDLPSDFFEQAFERRRKEFGYQKKSQNKNVSNSSTLSLHITAYENSIENTASDHRSMNGNKNSVVKMNKEKGLIKKWKNRTNYFSDSTAKTVFELPRMQERAKYFKPEVMQFKASQKLLNPNQAPPTAAADYCLSTDNKTRKMATLSTTSTKDTTGGSSDTQSTSYQAYTEMTAEQEFFLYELETTDSSSIGLVLRAIYDSGDVHKFARALEQRIAHYDKNILKVCTHHYQGFIDSMSQLKNLQGRCSEIKEISVAIDHNIQQKSKELVKKGSEIVRYRKLQKNANTAIEQITMCLPVLENFAKLQNLMKQKKYYQALKVLEDLEHTYGAQINKYRFTQSLAKSMGPIRNEIKKSSYDELRCFLEDVAKIWKRIGEDAIKATAIQTGFYKPSGKKDSDMESRKSFLKDDIQLSKDGTIIQRTPRTSDMEKKKMAEQYETSLSATDNIDFAPIHRCCQIFNVLGDKEAFENYYRDERKKQAETVITPPTKLQESIKSSVDYLDKIVGFFVVEDHIMNSQPGLVTKAYRDHLYEMALQKITDTMNTHFGNCLDVEKMIQMKKVILLFALTMKSYGYNINSLYSLLQNFRDQYNEILMSEYCAQFEKALKDDNYTPITVNNEEEYKSILVEYPHYKRLLDKEEYPRKFPFSRFVPTVFNQAKSYLRSCMRFMENLQLSPSEVDDTVRKYGNVLLARWSGSLKHFVSDRNVSLIQLVQITINMGYLERSCEFLERYITELTNRSEGSHLVTLNEQVFRDARSEVEQLIDAKLHEKVGEFLELSNYDWELPQSSGVASDYIADLIKFLNTTFISFTQLPSVLARHVCMQTCKYLADQLHSMLLSPDVKAVSMGALDQFSLDVMQCEMFTAQCPVVGFDEATLSITFAHLRQLLDLVMHADWTTYLAQRTQQNSKYARVKASDAATLLEKMIEFEKKNSSFFSRSGDRKKLYDTILRQLRTLA